MRPTVRVRFFPGRSAVSLSHSCVGPRIRIAGAQSKIARVRHNPLMRIHIGTDHAGFELKNLLKDHWRRVGHEVIDHGAHGYDPLDDYPGFCFSCAEGVVADPGSLGVVLGGSGNGEQIEIRHRATSRAHYADGSLRACRFLADKAHGLYDMRAVLGLSSGNPST